MKTMIYSPSHVHAMMTGAVRCTKNERHTTLDYQDGSSETVNTPELGAIDWENWFSIVGAVQGLRKPVKYESQ